MAKKTSIFRKIQSDVQAILDESMFGTGGEPSRFYKFIHFWVLVVRSFLRNHCLIRASALSYATLLALIPMLALVMSVTTSMLKGQGQEKIEQFIGKFVANVIPPGPMEMPDTNAAMLQENWYIEGPALSPETTSSAGVAVAPTGTNAAVSGGSTSAASASEGRRIVSAQKAAAEQIYGFIHNTQSGTVTGIGAVLLIIVAIKMVQSIELTLNDIWGVKKGRGWGLSVALYWTTITLGPVLLASALGLASGPHFEFSRKFLENHEVVAGLIFKLLPLMVLWLAFALFYKGLPNTKVHFNAALVGGMVAGTIWHVNNLFGYLYVSRVVSNSKIYGSLGLIPVFMAGIYFSWLVFLFGAQVAYAFQNRALYLQERLAENVNQRGREFVALRLMTSVGQRFQRGLPPATIHQMSSELGIPSRLVQQVLQTLIAAHLVVEISGLEPAYSPARPLDDITAHHVLQAMRATNGQELVTRDEPVRAEVYGEYARIQEAEKRVASSVSILALVNRAQMRLEIAPPPSSDETEIKLSPALVPSSSEPASAPAPERGEPAEMPPPKTEVATAPAARSQPAPSEAASVKPLESASVEIAAASAPPVRDPVVERSPRPQPQSSAIIEPQTDEDREFPL